MDTRRLEHEKRMREYARRYDRMIDRPFLSDGWITRPIEPGDEIRPTAAGPFSAIEDRRTHVYVLSLDLWSDIRPDRWSERHEDMTARQWYPATPWSPRKQRLSPLEAALADLKRTHGPDGPLGEKSFRGFVRGER